MSAPYPWLTSHWRQFESWRAVDRVPHAVLLTGPPGWGKAQFAWAMVAELLGLPRYADDPNRSQDDAERPVHADLRWIEADVEAGSRQIKIDQIREFAGFIASTSMSGVKVGVIAEAERMNINASNALLKTLEEPAGRAHIILLSHRPSALLPTLRSRCQVLSIAPAQAQAQAWLNATASMTTALQGLLWLAGHAPLRALALQRDGGGDEALAALAELPRLAAGGVALTPTLARVMAADPLLLLDGWLRALHDAAVGNMIPPAAGDWSNCDKSRMDPAGRCFVDELLQAKRHVLSTSNPNMPWLFEGLLLRWQAA